MSTSWVSLRKLEHALGLPRKDLLRVAAHAGQYYEPFDLKKVGGREWRHVDNPTGSLVEIQRRIRSAVLAPIELPSTMYGGIRERSIKDAVAIHVGQPVVITLDLRSFFPRVQPKSIFDVFVARAGCSAEIAGILTKLTTFQHRLPQGAPTSSLLANLAVVPLHDAIQAVAVELGLAVTFYCDDIAISGTRARQAIGQVIDLVHKHGHSIKHSKLKVMDRGGRQSLVGVVVNAGMSGGRARSAAIRQDIKGLVASAAISESRARSVLGKIRHCVWLNPSQGRSLLRYFEKQVLSASIVPDGSKLPPGERRSCDCARRHRVRRGPSAREEIGAMRQLKQQPESPAPAWL